MGVDINLDLFFYYVCFIKNLLVVEYLLKVGINVNLNKVLIGVCDGEYSE